jgi:hypothetical protein
MGPIQSIPEPMQPTEPAQLIHVREVKEVEELDSIVTAVVQKYSERARIGKKKYGTTLDRDDLTVVDWVNHTQEELMDATLYLEKLKQTLIVKKLDNKRVDLHSRVHL